MKLVIAEKAKEKEETRKTTFQKSEKSNMPEVNTTKELAKVAEMTNTGLQKSVNPIIKVDTQNNDKAGGAVRPKSDKAVVDTQKELAKSLLVFVNSQKLVKKKSQRLPKKEEIAFVNNDKSYISEQPKTTTPDKQKAADIRKFSFDVLEYYKAVDYISDYQKQIKGRSITGIVIKL